MVEQMTYSLLIQKKLMLFLLALLLMSGCNDRIVKTMEVTVTAYNSASLQTHPDHPYVSAFGDSLEPGMKVIAVSHDLISMGLDYDTEVKIEGLEGTYRVLDKMKGTWEKRIDIYMGNDIEAARQWGKQKLEIKWKVDPDEYPAVEK